MELRALWLLPILVLIAGCAQPSSIKTDINNGIIIANFSIDPAEVSYDDKIYLSMDIENVGGTRATDVEARLYGVEEIFRDSSGSILHSVPEKGFGSMNPPNEIDKVLGESKAWTYLLMPPGLPEGVKTDFIITGRVTFTYHTTGTVSVPAYSKTLYDTKTREGEAVAESVVLDNTYAPIQISLKRGTAPALIDDTRNGTQEAIYVIQFENKGSGYPVTEDVIGRMYGEITVAGPGVSFSDCLGANEGNDIIINSTSIDLVKLRSDGTVPVYCTIRIQRDRWGATTSGNILFTVDMNYKYYVDEDVSIAVHGRSD